MDLARLSVKLRPRTPWEGIDLGFSLARHWFLPLWLIWLASAVPVCLLLNLVMPIPLWLAGVLAWWFKPLYEPPLLYWLGRATFAERPGPGEMRRHWWCITRNRLLANLTWRRLSPSRSFVMPVAVLEGLTGKARASRIQVLSRGQHVPSWLTLVGLHFEIILELSLLILLVAMLPEELRDYGYREFLFEPTHWQLWLQQLIGLLAMSLIAPFYVAAGFDLYLTRRSELEAWDIELGFRKLARRVQAQRRVAPALLLMGFILVGLTQPGPPPQAAQLTRGEAKALIDEVLEADDFGQRETRVVWRYQGQSESDAEAELPPWLEWLSEIIAGFTRGFARVGEVLMWLALGGLMVYLLVWFLRNRELLGAAADGQPRKQASPLVLGLDIRPESLPDDIPGAALRLFREDAKPAALSLLYRGSLSALVYRYRLKVPGSATEGECLELAGQVLDTEALAYQEALIRAWRDLAYAQGDCDIRLFERLCTDWKRVYGQ